VNVLGVPRVGIDTPPRVRLSTGSTATPTRHVTVKAQAAGVDEAQVDDDPAFGTPVVVTLSTHSTYFNEGQAAWDFGLAAADDTLQLFVRAALAQGGFSPAGSLAVAVNFDPALTVMEAPVVDPDVHLEVPVTGVERMRFATSEAGLDTAPWIVPERAEPDTTTDLVEFQLSTQQATPEIWAQYEGDFGFDVTTTTTVTPSPVAPATLTIDGGAEFTSAADRRVLVTSQAPNATLMRIGEDPDFTGVPWLAYSDTLTVQLSTPPGLKTLYGWYVNGFDATGRVASNQITLVGESPRPR
jgi:hypothetical protein